MPNVSPASLNVALQSVLFLYREIPGHEIENTGALRSKRPQRISTVLSVSEVAKLLHELRGRNWRMGQLLYGYGLRIGEAISLPIKDHDVEADAFDNRPDRRFADSVQWCLHF